MNLETRDDFLWLMSDEAAPVLKQVQNAFAERVNVVRIAKSLRKLTTPTRGALVMEQAQLRKKAAQNLFLTDSLITLYNQNIQYLNSVRKVISEDISFEDSDFSTEELESQNQGAPSFIQPILEDSLLRAFVFQQDKYNPAIIDKAQTNNYLFPPALGPISQPFDLEASHYAVDIVVEENTPIMAIADGTVIFSEWTAETGFVIILEHSLGMLSVYSSFAFP